jgi:nicotinate phosphoribosyltransferase
MNDPTTTLLLTDLYQLNMMKAYLDHEQTRTAVFEFFVRKLPPRRGFLIAAGLEQAIDFLENSLRRPQSDHCLLQALGSRPSCSIEL